MGQGLAADRGRLAREPAAGAGAGCWCSRTSSARPRRSRATSCSPGRGGRVVGTPTRRPSPRGGRVRLAQVPELNGVCFLPPCVIEGRSRGRSPCGGAGEARDGGRGCRTTSESPEGPPDRLQASTAERPRCAIPSNSPCPTAARATPPPGSLTTSRSPTGRCCRTKSARCCGASGWPPSVRRSWRTSNSPTAAVLVAPNRPDQSAARPPPSHPVRQRRSKQGVPAIGTRPQQGGRILSDRRAMVRPDDRRNAPCPAC